MTRYGQSIFIRQFSYRLTGHVGLYFYEGECLSEKSGFFGQHRYSIKIHVFGYGIAGVCFNVLLVLTRK
jgi:hypothetical protein